MTFRFANVAGRAALVHGDHYFDLAHLTDADLGPDPQAALAHTDRLHELAAGLDDATPTGSLSDVVLGAPVPRPVNCFGIGLNYRSHAAESGMAEPEAPVVFTKFPTCISPPNADVVLAGDAVDYEVELVVVIGPGGKDIPASEAWAHVAGVTAGQDISDRALQFAAKPPHFDLGKSRDTYGPVGPILVSPDCLPDPDDVGIECLVNGERRQKDRTSQLIFPVPVLIEYLSSILTLRAGDVIFTGTPDGVGMASGKLLTPGDVITTNVEGVGTMTNRCV